MQADLPFYDCPEDALKAAVQAIGGAKKVGSLIWPDKTPDNAARLIMDCLNPSRPEKFDISQIMAIFTMAKDAGIHSPFGWYCSQIGYDARPITRAEEVDRLTSVIEQSTNTLANALTMLGRIKGAA